ncbi:MAG TPA: hypothetical protein VGU71_06580 [Candidatus Dormibacteraeota bacterium]|nr:hypothetical protein [Candidatus Dormibacteraeota bacterium]
MLIVDTPAEGISTLSGYSMNWLAASWAAQMLLWSKARGKELATAEAAVNLRYE